jgi:PAS domain S-box-containing protein
LGIDAEQAPPEWRALLDRVNQAYAETDQERYRLERSIATCSEEMSELNARLSEERDQLRAIFESAAVGIVQIDARGVVLECNQQFADMLGRARDEVVGADWLGFVHEEDRAAARRFDASRGASSSTAEWRFGRRDGTTAWAELDVSAVGDARGSELTIAIVRDITAQRHLEVSLRHAQKLEAVGRLAAGIAHEINTPIQFVGDNLTFMRSAVEVLRALRVRLRGLAEPAALAEIERELDLDYLEAELPLALEQSVGGIEHIAKIVRAMKFMSSSDRGQSQSTVDLNTILRNAATVATPETKYVADVVFDEGELPTILAHATDLNQVFLNLIVNAAHAIADRFARTSERGTITVRTRHEGDDVVVAIQDTGAGIPADIQDKIFDPFFTTKELGRGSGQGLAIARSIVVDKHGGALTFESTVGEGTTFSVRLPARLERGGKAA